VVKRVCSSDRILDKVESLIGPSIKLFSDQTLMKPAFHGSAIIWHQDYPYWPFDRPELVSCWLAIDAATRENGCMLLIPGSHRDGVLPTQESSKRLRDQEGADNRPHVAVELPAGHCLFHHCLTLHSSPPNSSPESRRAISITFMPGDLKWTGEDTQNRDFLHLRG
jgi:ectoine hydroxylase-related dioxygenase (phytanoyl-CoA dioxygenase family)